MLDDPVGAAPGLVRLLGAIDRHEYLGNPRFRLADVGADTRERVLDLGFRHVNLGTDLAANDLGPGNRRLDLLYGDVIADADALQILPELAPRHAGGSLDFGNACVYFRLGGLYPEPLGILYLEPFVDHLPKHLCGEALAHFRCVLEACAADRKKDALAKVEVRYRVVIDPRHDPKPLCRSQEWADDEGENGEGADDQRRHRHTVVNGRHGIIGCPSHAAMDRPCCPWSLDARTAVV